MHSGFWGFALHTLGIVKQFPKNVEQSEFGSSDITGLSEISGMFYYHIIYVKHYVDTILLM